MTFQEWKDQTNKADAAAKRIQQMIASRAQRAFDAAFYEGHKSDNYSCFHLAHNWQSLPSLTPIQRHTCRLVKHLESKQWESSRVAESLSRKLWNRIDDRKVCKS